MAANKKGYSVQEAKFTGNIKNFSMVNRKKWCKWAGPFDDDIDYNDLVTLGTKHGVDTRSYTVFAHRNLNIYWQAMRSIVLTTQLLADNANHHMFSGIQIRFRDDVRRIFEKFSAGQMSDREIMYLPLSQDYPSLIRG